MDIVEIFNVTSSLLMMVVDPTVEKSTSVVPLVDMHVQSLVNPSADGRNIKEEEEKP